MAWGEAVETRDWRRRRLAGDAPGGGKPSARLGGRPAGPGSVGAPLPPALHPGHPLPGQRQEGGADWGPPPAAASGCIWRPCGRPRPRAQVKRGAGGRRAAPGLGTSVSPGLLGTRPPQSPAAPPDPRRSRTHQAGAARDSAPRERRPAPARGGRTGDGSASASAPGGTRPRRPGQAAHDSSPTRKNQIAAEPPASWASPEPSGGLSKTRQPRGTGLSPLEREPRDPTRGGRRAAGRSAERRSAAEAPRQAETGDRRPAPPRPSRRKVATGGPFGKAEIRTHCKATTIKPIWHRKRTRERERTRNPKNRFQPPPERTGCHR
ncbi:translation initiation factor IF-2-like [Lemur catta]|uniref:translation initiation factor IF-2-like n=1 Tax=Lemur catta TaxID=9447 RepID=UPI001E26772C|nr:translation initiation factor IF-2-like [Lemur catta]